MADLVPVTKPAAATPLSPGFGGPGLHSVLTQVKHFAAQPAAKKLLPWFAGAAGIGLLALTWAAMSPDPQRMLYSSLADGERAEVVAALDQAGISYRIDNATGALTVGEDDLYRARMTVASQGALAVPESGTQLIDSLPMGASRTLEGDRLRAAQERELQLTIVEIDGVEAVRVHLAQAEKSVFVRQETAPTASVMLRLVRGKSLSDSQVTAIANLVAASVPGLGVDNVRIVDQHGRLLSDTASVGGDRLELQARTEAKLRAQVSQLLTPMLGQGNFSSEVQVDLDMEEVTAARESYDKDGAIRRESTSEVRSAASRPAIGVPGVTSNTPPVDPEAVARAPEGTEPERADGQMGETSANRTYELGREVEVSNTRPGGIKRLSVAVALNADALGGAGPEELGKLEELIAAAVGANPDRGDNVAVMTRAFESAEFAEPPFWEAPWFATVLRNLVALLGVLLVLLLAVRPALKMLKPAGLDATKAGTDAAGETGAALLASTATAGETSLAPLPLPSITRKGGSLAEQVELARRIAREQPDDALQALRRMLAEPASKRESDSRQEAA